MQPTPARWYGRWGLAAFGLLLSAAAAIAQSPVSGGQPGASGDELQSWATTREQGERRLGDVQGGGDKAGELGGTPRITGSYAGPGRASPARKATGLAPSAPLGAPGTADIGVPQNPPPPNEFQKFVGEATGTLLPIYGSEFFSAAAGYTPPQSVPVPADYVLGPGDEVLIRSWGTVDFDFRAFIDRDGLINIPRVGTVALSGVRAGNAEQVLRAAIGNVYRGFQLNVTLGQLRGITIYVTGHARRPGTYTVSSLSTVVTALFESGGPSSDGSLRHVQVKRGGRVAAEMDLYAFIARGDKSNDIKLLDGDVIAIPPAGGYVALTGSVETRAIYELRGNEDTLESLLDLAGGIPVVADPRRVVIEHVEPGRKLPRSVEDLPLDAAGLKRILKRGDVVSVLPIQPEFSNAITLRVKGGPAFRTAYLEGMKISDLIPDRASLLSRTSVVRQNRFDRALGDQYGEFIWDHAVIERLNRADLSVKLLSFNLGRAIADPASSDNLVLQVGDTVTVFTADEIAIPIAKRRVFVTIEGEVRRPGAYQVEPGETLVNLVEKAGGTTPDAFLFGAAFYRESLRKSQQQNLDKLIARLEQEQLSQSTRQASNVSTTDSQTVAVAQARIAAEDEARKRFLQRLREVKSTGRMSLGLTTKDVSLVQVPDFRLENSDRLVIPARPDFVQVAGAVNTESALMWRPGRSVADYLSQAGISRDGDKDNAFVLRADGTVASESGSWFSSVGGLEVSPGDIIVVPEKQDRETAWTTFMRNAKDITQVLSNFGLGAAAIHTLSK